MADLLNRDQILKAEDAHPFPVEVPEWGGQVLIKPLSGEARDKYEASNLEEGRRGRTKLNLLNARARLCALCIYDGFYDEQAKRWVATERMFSSADVKQLGKKSAAALDRVAEAAQEASGISDEQMEEMVEGFDEAPEDGPGEPSYSG